ncbi:hypothetical protein [Acinetobacter dispersus]|uniref:Uncharacterized protein n=1 Tax=Acinetobacter dispersus TaxID=70348 RepID=N9MTS7_9GAMM|nr:hypothetical protein [Acinetobacter dispersus]ENW93349.1 hypothetical protein F904_01473 [Acinetobacter dispersus]
MNIETLCGRKRNIDDEIREAEHELKHIGSCSTADLTQEQIAQLDERSVLVS